jgi:amidohydrolase
VRVEREKTRAAETVASLRPLANEIIEYLRVHAEIGGEEFESSAYLAAVLGEAGFEVERGVGELPTAFLASGPRASGPCLAFLAEYDALPGIGHACGHNASAAVSIVAALGLVACQRDGNVGGTALVVGTPGEENLSCKVRLVERSIFSGVDAAMMVHAFDKWASDVVAMACDKRDFSFSGRASHAAAAPEGGVNALDAVMLTFHGVNCLRQHVVDSCRIHGIVTRGGEAPNIVPDFAQARYYIRSRTRSYLNDLTSRVERCAEGAALMTGARLDVSSVDDSLDDILVNRPFLSLYDANLLRTLDLAQVSADDVLVGSTDVGNLSHVIPTIHPLGAFAPLGTALHTSEFAEATRSGETLDAVIVAATALAQTALDLIIRSDSMSEVRRAFLSAK